MTILTTLYSKTIKSFHQRLREITYEKMSHQAFDWAPDDVKTTRSKPVAKPVRLNFKVAKRNRIHWIRRMMQP